MDTDDPFVETKPEISRELDAVVASLLSEDTSKFDENPSWLLEDIRELKHLNRLKLIRALPEKEEVLLRPKSSKKAVACEYEMLPDVLVHSKGEANRGKKSGSQFKKSSSAANLIINISREETTQHNLDALHQREQHNKIRRLTAVKGMASSSALPLASTRYLERRQELSRSPTRGTAGFRTSDSLARPRTAPNRGRTSMRHPEGGAGEDAFLVSKDDGHNKKMGSVTINSRKKSPSPDKYKNPEEEKRQRTRILMTVLMGWWYAKNLKLTFALERQSMAAQYGAASVLQRRLRALMKRRRVLHAADVVPPCLRRAISNYRKRKYISLVKGFLIECAKNQKSKIIRQFLYRVRRLQKLIKNWLVTQRARTEIMKRYWDRVEYAYRKNLADEYRAAQDLLIETERKMKRRARAPIAELWSKTNHKVALLLKKADRVQLRAAREKAFEDSTEMPQLLNSTNDITLGEFEGKISDERRLRVIHNTVKQKRNLFLQSKKMEKMAATQSLSTK
jgi:hypothetical protein